MIKIDIEEKGVFEYEGPVSGKELLESLSNKAKKQVIALKVNDELCDIDRVIESDAKVKFLTQKDSASKIILNHSTAHILAQAVITLHPEAKVAIGPAEEERFFYDFEMEPVGEEQLQAIEAKMNEIIKANHEVTRREVTIAEAKELFKDEPYKLEIISGLEGETVSLYSQGDFMDLCRGPHLASTGRVPSFKLLSSSGVYWKGDADGVQLQRIYGTAFFDKKELDKYLKLLKEREERDHNKVGRKLGYFTSSNEVGQGLPLFTPKGAKLRQVLQRFIEDEEENNWGYQLTMTPAMARSDLYEISGHWQLYREGMHIVDMPDYQMALRPMTCPFQFMIYKSEKRSYRDLPIRYTETSPLFRNEGSGAMHGLIRVRQFHLADGHVICRPDQVEEEFIQALQLIKHVMEKIGLKDTWYRFSKWDPNKKDKYIDNPAAWDNSQKMMKKILDDMELDYVEADGEAAFYGPKLDLQIRNVYGKEDTVMTVQLDFALPERFKMTYTDKDGEEVHPFVIHRSSIGCYERTIAFLLEQYGGKLPFWYTPEQVVIMPVNDSFQEYAVELNKRLRSAGVRSKLDFRSETVNKKIREAQKEYIPLMIVVGEQEVENRTVAVRSLDKVIKNNVDLEDFLKSIKEQNDNRELLFDMEKLKVKE